MIFFTNSMIFFNYVYRLLLGIMLVSWFLSVWISNTATTAMMLPIVLSLVKNLVKLDTAFHESEPEPRQVNIYICKIFTLIKTFFEKFILIYFLFY